MEILDINFNFRMIEENIEAWLDAFNVAKDEFFAGRETEEEVIKFGEQTLEKVSVGLEFFNCRLSLIDEEYMDEKNHIKTKLKKERCNLLKKISWYENLKDSIMADCDVFEDLIERRENFEQIDLPEQDNGEELNFD